MHDRPGNVNVFILYAAADEDLKDELENHLSLLQHHGYIDVWHEGLVEPGAERDRVISEYIQKAHIVLLLVSAQFLAPDCYTKYEAELRAAYERQQRGEVKVIPVILRHCMWQLDILASLSPLPRGGHPVRSTHWESSDLAFRDIVRALQQTAQELLAATTPAPAPPPEPAAEAPPEAAAPPETPAEPEPRAPGAPASDRDREAGRLIDRLLEVLGRSADDPALLDLLHPSLAPGGRLDPAFRAGALQRAAERRALYQRPARVLGQKPTGRTHLGFGAHREDGEEVAYTVARVEDVGALPGYVRVFFPAPAGAARISGLGL